MKTLIVENHHEARSLFEITIRSLGHEVTACADAETALLAYHQSFHQLIILDLGLPGIDGLEFCRRIRTLPGRERSMIMVITGYDGIDVLRSALEAGADDYVIKPVSPELLTMRILIIEQQLQNHIQRKQAEETLREHEETARALLNAPTDAIVLINTQGIVLEMNQTSASRLNSSIERLIGTSLWTLLSTEGTERIHPQVQKVIQTGKFAHFEEQWQDNWCDIVMYPIFDIRGRVKRIALIVRNIHERKQREEEKRKEKQQLEELLESRTRELLDQKRHLQEKTDECTRMEQAFVRLQEIEVQQDEQFRRAQLRLRSIGRDKFGDMTGGSPAMQIVYDRIEQASRFDFSVIIYGESGTGKELVARTIHQRSQRKEKAFVPVNCGAIPEDLFESEFFGHKKGAFTGAHRDQEGFFDRAHQGTLFLDEIGELKHSMQVKLLRAIEDGEYSPVGDNTCKNADVRIIAATNSNLEEQVKKGRMRKDFFYRIKVLTITAPPLRDRKEDISLLLDHFLKQYGKDEHNILIPKDILRQLAMYEWPGNVRELQNVLQRYLTAGSLDFSGHPGGGPASQRDRAQKYQQTLEDSLTLRAASEQFEKEFILSILERHHWHREKTAKVLGIPSRTLHRKMKKHQIN